MDIFLFINKNELDIIQKILNDGGYFKIVTSSNLEEAKSKLNLHPTSSLNTNRLQTDLFLLDTAVDSAGLEFCKLIKESSAYSDGASYRSLGKQRSGNLSNGLCLRSHRFYSQAHPTV